MKTLATALSDEVIASDHFKAMMLDADRRAAAAFLRVGQPDGASSGNIDALVRYSDILSQSEDQGHRQLALDIVGILFDEYLRLRELGSSTLAVQIAALIEANMVEAGNFPGLDTLHRVMAPQVNLPPDRELTRFAKTLRNWTSTGKILTDSQARIVDSIGTSSNFSFAGPTSLGKSFLLRELIARRLDATSGYLTLVVVVPSVALISQTVDDLRAERFSKNVVVLSHPNVPSLVKTGSESAVLVLTPERLLRYLADSDSVVSGIFVDEAHKAVAENDLRAPLYYQAIHESVKQRGASVGFASPNVSNPEIFQEIFEVPGPSIAIEERVVAQRRYHVDLVDEKATYFSRDGVGVDFNFDAMEPVELVSRLSGGEKSIVYLNSPEEVSAFARALAQEKDRVLTTAVGDALTYLSEAVHRAYFLRQTLGRGVAFHHGRMPSEVRRRVEELFVDRSSGIDVIVCTSTLLEGVNMPAKNIFLLHDKQGPSGLRALDLNNLAGRAGRLTREFYGNVVFVRAEMKRWDEKKDALMRDGGPQMITSFMSPESKRRAPLNDIALTLRGERPKKWTGPRRAVAQRYASILTAQRLEGVESQFLGQFLARAEGGDEALTASSEALEVPASVIKSAPEIDISYQQRLYSAARLASPGLLPSGADLNDLEVYYQALRRLSEAYNWESEESLGHNPLIRGRDQDSIDANYWYWARIMRSWVLGDPLSRIIASALKFHDERGVIRIRDWDAPGFFREEAFNKRSRRHINIIIENTFRDVDGGLRHTILRYAQNFNDVAIASGNSPEGDNLATLLEYGTGDPAAISLQQLGVSRSASIDIADVGKDALVLDISGQVRSVRMEVLTSMVGLREGTADEVLSVIGPMMSGQA